MYMKRITDNESGLTYTLEAIIGVVLIIGTVIFMTGNIPYTAQKTGEHSKVQLMNIGRDNLDLTLITSIYETCPSCVNVNVPRQYWLRADKEFVIPNETVNFTVTYSDGTPVNKWLTLQNTTLGSGIPFRNMTKINNTANYSWSDTPQNLSEFSIQANDFAGGVSNIVTIKVGWYFLYSNTNGVRDVGTVVSGWVKNASAPVNGLRINLGRIPLPYTDCTDFTPSINTTYGTGNFSFGWPDAYDTGGIYYINATDGVRSSNKHFISYSQNGGGGEISVYGQSLPYPGSNQTITIKELDSAYIWSNEGINIGQSKLFWVNNVEYISNPTTAYSLIYDSTRGTGEMNFTGYLAGDYYIDEFKPSGTCTGVGPVKTNSVLIHVLPLVPATGETQDNCINATELNGYPTDETVAVSKLAHILYSNVIPNIDNIVEYRMVLWYK
jgi:hypothetical protein